MKHLVDKSHFLNVIFKWLDWFLSGFGFLEDNSLSIEMLPRLVSRVARPAAAANGAAVSAVRTMAAAAAPPPPPAAPEKIECFIDGKKVLVDPGTTVLQVRHEASLTWLHFFILK